MLSENYIVCVSTQDWNDLWTRKQRFMFRFAQQGNKVLYVEQQIHILGYFKRFKAQWKRLFKWMAGSRKLDENLYVYALPVVLPFYQMWPWVNKINYWFITYLLKRQLSNLGFKDPILWTYAPYSYRLLGKLGEKFIVYECVDEFSASKGLVKGDVVHSFETQLIKQSDLVIVTAQDLYDSKRSIAKEIYLIPNAAEVEHFKKASSEDIQINSEVANIEKPIIGFLGSISYWIDISLIQHVALSHPEWSILMVGPVRTDVSKIVSLLNVHIIGRKDYQDLPGYIKAFDVCINPYVMDGVAEGCSPLKLYEYLATGKPVVSVNMPEAVKFEGLIRIASSKKQFVLEIEAALCEDGKFIEERMKESYKHSWEERFRLEDAVVHKALNSSGLE